MFSKIRSSFFDSKLGCPCTSQVAVRQKPGFYRIVSALLIVSGAVLSGHANAQFLSMPALEGPADIGGTTPQVSMGASFGDVDNLGARFSGNLSPSARVFGELTGLVDGPADADLGVGGGFLVELPTGLPLSTGVRGKAHTALDEFGDVWSTGLSFLIGDVVPVLPRLSWYGGVGFDYFGIDSKRGAFNRSSDETEIAILGGANYKLAPVARVAAELSKSYDDLYLGAGIHFSL
jgi:hypothetical protein